MILHDEVHVWCARLDLPYAALHRLYGILAPDEQSEAARFRFHADCCRFIARRGILRHLLAKYTTIAPAEVDLRRSAQGKLHIAAHQSSRIRFNLSRSRWFAIFAIALDRDVGIDIERIEQGFAWRDFSKVVFSGREQDFISRMPTTRQPEAFFELWTRKESILKALGMGLQFDPTHINVADDYAPGKVAVLRHDGCLWKLMPLSKGGFATTVAAAGTAWRVRRHHWPTGSVLQ